MVASDILQESGFETFHAYDAEAAAELLEAHPEIEVIVTEAQLPGDVNGVELCHRVSLERPDVQLVVTAVEPRLHQAEVPSGAQVLRKPYASGELQTLVATRVLVANL
jgi:CheY-like chemotaxis protein